MAGNPSNVNIWGNADVYVLFPENLPGSSITDAVPADIDTDPGVFWEVAGLLDGEAGFEEGKEWDKTEHPAWGYGIIIVGHKNFKMTQKFTALEENEVTDRLDSNDDTATHVKVSKPTKAYLMFETVSDAGVKRRRITTVPASISSGGRTINESDMPSREFEADIFANSDKQLFIKQDSAPAGSGS